MDKKNSQVFSAVAVPMSVAVVVVVVMVVAAGIMCFVANGGEGAADGLLPTPALIGNTPALPAAIRFSGSNPGLQTWGG